MYSHFQLFGAQPVIFCNINDPASMKRDEAADYSVAGHKVSVSVDAIADTIKVSVTEGEGETAIRFSRENFHKTTAQDKLARLKNLMK